MKTIKYEIKNERISVQEEIDLEDMKEYTYILIFDKTNKEYIVCRYNLYYEENLELIWFIDLESDYNYLVDKFLGYDIEIIGFLESFPYNYEQEETIMFRKEAEKEIIEKENMGKSLFLYEKD